MHSVDLYKYLYSYWIIGLLDYWIIVVKCCCEMIYWFIKKANLYNCQGAVAKFFMKILIVLTEIKYFQIAVIIDNIRLNTLKDMSIQLGIKKSWILSILGFFLVNSNCSPFFAKIELFAIFSIFQILLFFYAENWKKRLQMSLSFFLFYMKQ